MSEDYKTHLAARVLNDNSVMTYRLLSRELKVHVNRAKEMLFAFYESTNKKKPGSCHATYLIAGLKSNFNANATESNGKAAEEEDTIMMSSPFEPSMPNTQVDEYEDENNNKDTIHIVAVPEEDLEVAKKTFSDITSIHIYSIEAAPLQDLLVLSAATKEMYKKYSEDTPDYRAKIYGTTQNVSAKRRQGKKLPKVIPNVTSSKYVVPVAKTDTVTNPKAEETGKIPVGKKEVVADKKDFFAGARKKEASTAASKKDVKKEPAPSQASSSATAKPALKRGDSDIMKSFSKVPPRKSKQETPPKNKDSMEIDEPHFSDEEDDNDEVNVKDEPIESSKTSGKSKKERDEELRRMMDEDDGTPVESSRKASKQKSSEPDPEESKESSDMSATNTPGPTEQSSEAPKKRRGRRQVKKKFTTKDEDGYLVTRNELAWESFSEDDAAEPPKSTATSNASQKPKSSIGKGTGSGKTKSGNIMSFFGRK